jgi:hypothetical protein
VKLANTAAIEQYEGLKPGDDDSDAFHLAKGAKVKTRKGEKGARG